MRIFIVLIMMCSLSAGTKKKFNKLTDEERDVLIHHKTELRNSGKYVDFTKKGVFFCKRCNNALFKSSWKFKSETGWASFDECFSGSLNYSDKSFKSSIKCSSCKGHIGHVFFGEGWTDKSTRFCVNSVAVSFSEDEKLGRCIVGGGCFWGIEYFFAKAKGVVATTSGYSGGKARYPTYKVVSGGMTNHAEVVEIIYDKTKTDYKKLLKLFFEIHDPTQLNKQGRDKGKHYRSIVFYKTDKEKAIAEELINKLKDSGLKVVTQVRKRKRFWPAEYKHQSYCEKNNKKPNCHKRVKRFKD